jgi:hypothetical protein
VLRNIVAERDEIGSRNACGTEVAAAFTFEPRWLMGGRNPDHAYGRLVYYMCRSCGYVHWLVQDPADVPIDAKYGTRLIEPKRKRDSPYR